MAEPKLKKGQRVRILIDPPNGQICEGTIKVVQDEPGKTVGVELDRYAERAHSLDGEVDEKVDEARGITIGKGWWTRPESVEVIE